MKMKKLAALLLAGAMVIGTLAGCGSGSGDDGEGGSSSSKGGNGSGRKTITLMVSGTATDNDFETEVLPKLVSEHFEDIELEVTKLPDDNYYTALKTKLASGECPDLILVQPMYAGTNSVINLAEAGYLEPLNDLKALETSGGADGSGAASYTYNGNVYSIPAGVTMLGTFYNQDVFEANGLSVPTNWDEFLNCCEVLKQAGIQPIVMGDKDMYVMQFGLYQLSANKIYAKNADFDTQLRTGETSFTDKGTWDEVLEMYLELYEKGYIDSSSLGLGASQAIQKFIDGEAAMTFDGSFNASALLADGSEEFERGYFPLPANAAGEDTYAAMSIGGGIALYSGSDYKEECKELLELWFDGESDIWEAYVAKGSFVPVYGKGSDEVDDLFSMFMDIYAEGRSFYWSNQAWPSGTEDEMEALLSEAIGGQGTTADDIAAGMQRKFDELLKQQSSEE